MAMRSAQHGQIEAIISIHGHSEPVLDASGVPHKLVLHFDDAKVIDESNPTGAYLAWVQRKWAAEIGRPLTPPSIDDAKAIIAFAQQIASIRGIVLCQCQAGISRSPAAALLCLATWTGKGHEQYCAAQLRRARPSAVPLLDLVSFGDTLLGREGQLVQAVREVLLRAL